MRNLMESLCTLVCSSAEKTVDLISIDKARMDFRFHVVPVFPVLNSEVVTRPTKYMYAILR